MTDTSPSPSPFNKWWGIAAGVLLIIVIVGILLVTGVLRGGAEPTPSAPATTAPSENPPPVGATLCEVPGANDNIPTVGPEAEWATNVYFLYPTSPTFGPSTNPASSLWGCFQQSPSGALFAASNFFSGLLGQNYEAFAAEAAIAGPALDSWIVERVGQPSEQDAGRVAQIAGFQFVSVEPAKVTLNLGLRQSTVEAFVTLTLVWDEASSNWMVDMAESVLTPAVVDVDLYTPWAAA